MSSRVHAHRKGYYYEVKAGKRYAWCACGRSLTQPFCDGSRVGSGIAPSIFTAQRDEDVIAEVGGGIFLDGAGVVWTTNTKTAVAAGDVLFLPRKQVHSVQCTVAGGFDVVGVIYPGDNPSIYY